MLRGERGTVVSRANRSVGVPSCLAPLRRPAVRRPDPTSPWYVRVLDSTSLICSCFRFVETTTRTYHGRVGTGRRTAGRSVFSGERTSEMQFKLSNPKPEHTTGGPGRRCARRGGGARPGRGGAGQNRVPTGRVARKPTVSLAPLGVVDNCPERLFARTNKGHPM